MIATRRTDCDECGTYTTAIHGYEGWLCWACLDASLYEPLLADVWDEGFQPEGETHD
jgi:hypothetical protein